MRRNKYFKMIIAFLCFLIAVLPFFSQLQVFAIESFPDVSGVNHIYLYNLEHDILVYEKGSANSQIAPASTVKIMSGLIALRHLEGRMDEEIQITQAMLVGVEGFTVNFNAGDTVTVKDLLYGLICGGGNDAAIILANLCCGGTGEFVAEMNAEAKALGMNNTTYLNPTGIDTDGMTTTLSDLVILSKKAIQTPLFVEISSAPKHQYTTMNSNETRTIANRNALISSFSAIGYRNKYAKGLSSGMTDKGGYCVSAYASNGKDSYLCIAMGGVETTNGVITSYSVVNSLLNYVFNNYTYTKIASKGDTFGDLTVELALPTNGSQAVTVDCILEDDVYAYAPANIDYKRDLIYKTYFHNDTLTAPVVENTVVGGVDIFYKDELLSSARLVTADNVVESRLLVVLKEMKQAILSRTSIIFVIALALLLTLHFYFTVWRKKLKNKKIR